MTVKQLVKILTRLPEESRVLFENTDIFLNGYYEVTEVDDFGNGIVVLDSNHKKNYEDEGEG